MRAAILDIGSNTAKVLVAEKNDHGDLLKIDEKSLPCRLAKGLAREKFNLSNEAIESTLQVVDQLISFSQGLFPNITKIVATEALRRLKNADVLIDRIKKCYGLPIEILTGHQEASLIAKGLMTDPKLSSLSEFYAIDLGGGSLEIIQVVNGSVQYIESLPLGVVVMAEQFLGDLSKKPTLSCILSLQEHAVNILTNAFFKLPERSFHLVGTGGSVIFLRKIISRLNKVEFINQSSLSLNDIENIANQVNSLCLSKRISRFNDLPPDRADVFPAALIAIIEIMKFLELSNLTHSFHNLRYGLAQELLSDPDSPT